MRLSELFRLQAQLYFASAVVNSGGDTGTPAGDGAPSGGAGTPSGTPPQQAPPQIDWKTAPEQFRQGYDRLKQEHEQLKQKLEPWNKLGVQPEQVQQFQGGYQQVYNEIKGIGENLQIPENEIADAIRQYGLVRVLDHLRQELWEAEQATQGNQEVLNQRDLEERIQSHVTQALTPYQERENKRLVQEANSFVERTVNDIAAETFKKQGIDWSTVPPELKMFVETGTTEALKYDDQGLYAIKFGEGNRTAPIQKAFQTFISMFDAAYLARRKMETGAASTRGQQPPQQRQQQTKQPSLDEMIDNPDMIRTSQGRPAYST